MGYWKVPAKSKVKALEKKSGKIRFTSKKTKGRGVFVAPTNALDMTSSQLKNAVAVQYDNVSSFVVEFSAKGREEFEQQYMTRLQTVALTSLKASDETSSESCA